MEFDLYIAHHKNFGTRKFYVLMPLGEAYPHNDMYEYEYVGRGAFAMLGERSVSGSTASEEDHRGSSRKQV